MSRMGVLTGLRVIECGGIGPGPFCCMLLADMGAEVVRVDRAGSVGRDPLEPRFNPMLRGQQSVALDLKHPDGRDALLRLCDKADIVIEGFRPGVMERLGLGPDVITKRQPRIIYGRMTGWGQTGPLANAPGHDINYISLTGALHAIGTAESGPVPPLVLAGDLGGGGMFLALGVLAAYIEAQRSGVGQIVDAAVVDGASALMTPFHGMLAMGSFIERRESNRLDGGSYFYNVYETSDGEFISLASNEPQFHSRLLAVLGLDAERFSQSARDSWKENRSALAAIFRQRTRADWVALLEKEELCFAPVLRMSEAPAHPHHEARHAFVEIAGVKQPAPAPRFSRSASATPAAPPYAGEHTLRVLREWGFDRTESDSLLQSGAARQRP